MRNIPVTTVYAKLAATKAPVVVCRGGARSTKSYSVAQLIIYRFVGQLKIAILVTRKTMPALKITAYKLIVDLLKDYGYYKYCDHNRTDNIIYYRPTGSYIYFASMDDPEKIKSTEWNICWIEEATEYKYEDYIVLKTRLSAPTTSYNQLIMTLNPTSSMHWIKTQVVEKEANICEITSNYKDNPFLSAEYIDIIESLKHQDENYWRVYGEGEWGSLDHIIYNNYKIVDDIPVAGETIYGCDFGVANPTAVVECGITTSGIYVSELLYQTNMTNSDLIDWIKDTIPPTAVIYCDTAEPNRIIELRRANIQARKSDKSIKDGIDFCRRQQLKINKRSINLLKEIQAYTYKQDRNGNVIDEPVKYNDHLCDALRYAVYTHLGKKRNFAVVLPKRLKTTER